MAREEDNDGMNLVMKGLGVAAGIAIGPAFVIEQNGVAVPERKIAASEVDSEIKRLHSAIAKTQKQLSALTRKAEELPSGPSDEIALLMEAYRGMLASPRLAKGVEEIIRSEAINAEAAVQQQVSSIAAGFAAVGDEYLAARGSDVREVGNRLIRNLLQQHYNPFEAAPEGCITVAEEITPADTALMRPDGVAGFATVMGGAEGHTAIMARALGIPAVLGVAGLIGNVGNGDMLVVDGGRGEIIVRPTHETLMKYRQEAARIAKETKRLKSALRDVPSSTEDGVPIKLMANLELPREVESAIEIGAEGIGLLRTEFMFMNRPDLPDEDEQYVSIAGLLKRLDGKPLTVRTLDVGGEKLATALGDSIRESSNPALGLRAIRLGLREPALLDAQLAAILRASAHGRVRILVPMVSSASQMRQVRERMIAVERKLSRRGVKLPNGLPQLGAMIEIPAAALSADALSKVCDFFAIGSNDLTQYTLAIDRGDEQVADLYDPFHPAVLRLIQFTIAAAWRANISVSLCGEMAGDPKATALLLGLGLREFSMAPSRLLQVKQEALSVAMPKAIAFAESVMAKSDEQEIKALLEKVANL